MAQVFGFDVTVVMERNLMATEFRGAQTSTDLAFMFRTETRRLKAQKLAVEDIPSQDEMCGD
jgi:hypothetical protein